MSEERKRYQPRGKQKSKMPFVLVGIVVKAGVAGSREIALTGAPPPGR